MVSTGSPPVPLPVQVPPGHVLQQIVDERGTLRHVILSPAPPSTTGPAGSPGSGGSASGQQPSSSAAGTASASVGVLPLPTPMHPPPPPPPPHYVSIDWSKVFPLPLHSPLSSFQLFFFSLSSCSTWIDITNYLLNPLYRHFYGNWCPP